MAHAQQADRPLPQRAIAAAVLVAAMVAVAMLAAGMPNLSGTTQLGTGDRGGVSPALLQAERDWELQRRQQSGWVDPIIEAERDWELQRRQQSGGSE